VRAFAPAWKAGEGTKPSVIPQTCCPGHPGRPPTPGAKSSGVRGGALFGCKVGLEPTTLCLLGGCPTNWAICVLVLPGLNALEPDPGVEPGFACKSRWAAPPCRGARCDAVFAFPYGGKWGPTPLSGMMGPVAPIENFSRTRGEDLVSLMLAPSASAFSSLAIPP
jgi:hypothetical protein